MAEFLQIEIARIHTKDAEATVDGQPVALSDLAKLFFSYLCIDTNSLRGPVARGETDKGEHVLIKGAEVKIVRSTDQADSGQ